MDALIKAATLADKVAPGPWEVENENQSDAPYRHDEFALLDDRGYRLCGTENSDHRFGEIHDESDEDGHRAWNEPSRVLMEFIRLCHPKAILAMITDHRRRVQDLLEANNGYLERARTAERGNLWYDASTAPETGFFLAWSPDFPELVAPFKAEIFHNARKPTTPAHLSANHFTLWRPIPLPQVRAATPEPPLLQPIETAPKDGTAILITRPTRFPEEEAWHVVRWEDDWWMCHDGKFDTPLRGPDPTLWMHLPKVEAGAHG